MAATDYAQVGAILHRLGSALDRLGPASLVGTLRSVIAAMSEPPPGNPEQVADLAAAFRRAAADAAPVAADAAALAQGRLPAVWAGSAFASAAETAIATAHLVGGVRPAFDDAADALDVYADTLVELRGEHRELHGRLETAWHDATHVELFGHDVRALDVRELDDLAVTARQLIVGCRAVYRRSLAAADVLIARLGDVTARARATAVEAPPVEAVTLAALADPSTAVAGHGLVPGPAAAVTASAADADPVGTDLGVLPPWQLLRASRRRAGLDSADRVTFDDALAAAASPLERAYLWKALAAGHGTSALTEFADRIRGRSPEWLRTHLSVIDPARRGRIVVGGQPFAQTDGTTCGTTSIVVTRVLADPVYALRLTTDDDPGGLADEQQRLHSRTNPIWPEAFGTSPWGMERGLAAETGTRYDFRWADDTDPDALSTATRDVLAAVDAGHPVPLLVGNAYPAHYILVVSHDAGRLLVYNPAGGRLTEIGVDDLAAGQLGGATAFRHLHGLLTPQA